MVGMGLFAFAVLLFSLVFRHDSRWSAAPAAPTAAPAAIALPPTPAQAVQGNVSDAAQAVPTATAPLAELAPVQEVQPVAAAAVREARPAPDAKPGDPAPFWGPNYNAGDGKPAYVCGANTVASGLTLQVMQMRGFDVANGFHLGIVPISLNDAYRLGDDDYSAKVRAGEWDCVIEYVDENAELNMGVITAVIDESAGEIGIAARSQLNTYEDLAGKRIGVVDSHTTKFFANYTLTLLPEAARKTVVVDVYNSPDEALAAYLAGTLDAVSLTEPHLSRAATSVGSRRLVDTSQLRVIASSIITSRASIARNPALVQSFHTAWFAALKEQIENLDGTAASIAAWGQSQWTGVFRDTAASNMRDRLKFSAQATLRNNAILSANPAPVLSILETARAMWKSELTEEGKTLPEGTPEVSALLDFGFILQPAADSALATTGRPVNGTFSLQAAAGAPVAAAPVAAAAVVTTSVPAIPAIAPTATAASTAGVNQPETVAVLPCRTFTFLANSTQLTPESQRLLDVCVLPALRQRASIALIVRGSAAWPTGGDYTEESVRLFGASRAGAIVDYLVAQGIDRKRFIVEGVAPPPERRGITDTLKLAADRFVEMTLIVGGL